MPGGQNRDAQTKKGIYSDDFSSDAQSEVSHDEWSARIDAARRFVGPGRDASATVLEVDRAASRALFGASLVLLPGAETVLVEQADWSEDKNVNPYAVFEAPEATVETTPNIGRRGQTGIAVTGANFTPDAEGITVRCDGRTVAEGIAADAVGRASASFLVPAGARSGSRIVEMSDGERSAQATLQVHDPLVITRIQRVVVVRQAPPRIVRVPVVRTVWRWRWRRRQRDPLAQTFSFDRNRVVSAVGVEFTRKDAAIPVTVQIRGVTTGLPNEVVLAEKVLSPDEIELREETRIAFDDPVYAEANTSYAVVLLTNSNQYRVRIATLGRRGRRGTITRQTYAPGVLLESSNAETWTPLNAADLTLRIYGYDFEAAGEVRFKPVENVEFSELNLDEYSTVPEGTRIAWEYSTDGGATWDSIVPAEEENLPNLATSILVRARLVGGEANDTPALNFRDVNLVGYLNGTTGAYVTRENELTQGVASTKVYARMDVPSGASVDWYASNDGGETWESMALEATRKVDEEWRPEDRVLEVLVKKAERIREELGSVAKVLEGRIAESIGREGVRRDRLEEQTNLIRNAEADHRRKIVEDELEEARARQDGLKEEIDGLRNRLERSQQHIGITAPQFRQTLSMSLRLAGAPAIAETDPNRERDTDTPRTFTFPATSDALARDSSWTAALDTLRDRRRRGETFSEWRIRASARPVAFEDTGRLGENAVQLHLEHRVAQRLLSRFTAQGLIHHDLSKACLTTAPDAVPRVILLGRLAVYGPQAARLHEEIVPVTARWVEPSQRKDALTPYGRAGEQTTLASLQTALDEAGLRSISEQVQTRLAASAQADIVDLLPHLENRAAELLEHANSRLLERAEVESRSMTELLERQRKRIAAVAGADDRQKTFDFDPAERRQHEADRRAWGRRLDEIESELESEPRRIADAYTIRTHRVDPLGLVYLWPRTG